jgi:ATP adenylyltransferase
MAATSIQAPWRMDYIRSLEQPDDGCFLCRAGECDSPQARKQRLVLWTSEHCVVLINRFPYTNGHLLIAPRRHVADLDELGDDEALDLHRQTVAAEKLLKQAMNPQGFNVGINLGRAAGAGVPGHLHQHVVPRWSGDTNYMSVIGEVRVVPQAMSTLWDELIALVGQ